MVTVHRSEVLFFFAMAVLLYVAWQVRDVLLLVYVSALFAVVVTPAIQLVRRLHIGRWQPGHATAILVMMVLGVAAILGFFAFALPPIFRDAQSFIADWPRRAPMISGRIQHLPLAQHLDPNSLQQYVEEAIGGALGLLRDVARGVFWFFSWLILTAYFIVDGKRAFGWLMSLFPQAQRERLEPTLLRAEARVRKWLVAQGMLMLMLGSSSAVVFALLRVKYFYVLAVIAAVANIVPIIGSILSATLACTIAAMDTWQKAAGVLLFYLLYAQVESGFLTPRIMRTTLHLPPLAVIIALSLGAALAGVLGALVAVPTAALVEVLIDEYLVRPHRAPESALVVEREQEAVGK